VTEIPSKGALSVVHKGDRVLIRCAGSGGYGDPLEREPERVLQDLVDGYITPQAAHDLYGVILNGGGVDASATIAQRARIRESRPPS
jgi:N-methylhydantoinase B